MGTCLICVLAIAVSISLSTENSVKHSKTAASEITAKRVSQIVDDTDLVGVYSRTEDGTPDAKIMKNSNTYYVQIRANGRQWSKMEEAQLIPTSKLKEKFGADVSKIELGLQAGPFFFFKVQKGATARRPNGKGSYTFPSEYYAVFMIQETPLYKVDKDL